MENLIFEFCEYIADKNNTQADQKIIIYTEVERAIRNIIKIHFYNKKVDGVRNRPKRIDTAKEKLDLFGFGEFKKLALNNANLQYRTTNKIEFDHQKK
ncbi:MAG: hypothetical protein PUP90_18250 [Nostoc sp. S4]|nr:hypothetical protein [Nostoc sp. S4]